MMECIFNFVKFLFKSRFYKISQFQVCRFCVLHHAHPCVRVSRGASQDEQKRHDSHVRPRAIKILDMDLYPGDLYDPRELIRLWGSRGFFRDFRHGRDAKRMELERRPGRFVPCWSYVLSGAHIPAGHKIEAVPGSKSCARLFNDWFCEFPLDVPLR